MFILQHILHCLFSFTLPIASGKKDLRSTFFWTYKLMDSILVTCIDSRYVLPLLFYKKTDLTCKKMSCLAECFTFLFCSWCVFSVNLNKHAADCLEDFFMISQCTHQHVEMILICNNKTNKETHQRLSDSFLKSKKHWSPCRSEVIRLAEPLDPPCLVTAQPELDPSVTLLKNLHLRRRWLPQTCRTWPSLTWQVLTRPDVMCLIARAAWDVNCVHGLLCVCECVCHQEPS